MLKSWLDRLLRNPTATQWLILGFLGLLILAFSTLSRADEVSLGVGSTYIRGPTPTVGLIYEKDLDYRDFSAEFGLTLNGATEGNPNQMALDLRLMDGYGKFDIGIGGSYLQNRDEYNGSNLNFSLALRYNISDRWAIGVYHFSNAGTKEPNLGRDMIRVEHKF